jgi:predicted nucleotidyltransferase
MLKWLFDLREFSIEKIHEQVQQRMSKKYNWKRTPDTLLEMLRRKIYRRFSLRYKVVAGPSLHRMDDLGIDQFGRDVSLCLDQYARMLVNRGVRLHTLLVLGSRAKGRSKPQSDVDVLIIASNLPGIDSTEFANIAQKLMNVKRSFLLSDFPINVGVQSSACSREEFLRWFKQSKSLALDAVVYGKVVYDDGFWKKVIGLYREIKEETGLNEAELKRILFPL